MARLTSEAIQKAVLDPTGCKGLVAGIANEPSLVWPAAEHFRSAGAELAIIYLNDKAKPSVEPLATRVGAPIFVPCHISVLGQPLAVFEAIQIRWERLDSLIHSITSARKEDLRGRLTDCPVEASRSRCWSRASP